MRNNIVHDYPLSTLIIRIGLACFVERSSLWIERPTTVQSRGAWYPISMVLLLPATELRLPRSAAKAHVSLISLYQQCPTLSQNDGEREREDVGPSNPWDRSEDHHFSSRFFVVDEHHASSSNLDCLSFCHVPFTLLFLSCLLNLVWRAWNPFDFFPTLHFNLLSRLVREEWTLQSHLKRWTRKFLRLIYTYYILTRRSFDVLRRRVRGELRRMMPYFQFLRTKVKQRSSPSLHQ